MQQNLHSYVFIYCWAAYCTARLKRQCSFRYFLSCDVVPPTLSFSKDVVFQQTWLQWCGSNLVGFRSVPGDLAAGNWTLWRSRELVTLSSRSRLQRAARGSSERCETGSPPPQLRRDGERDVTRSPGVCTRDFLVCLYYIFSSISYVYI